MYLAIVAMLMFVFPVGSVILETLVSSNAPGIMALIGKWFVFWSVGVRLFTAGVRQAINPRATAKDILGISGDEALLLVQELGFANIGVGLVGIISLFQASWVAPAALAGGLFYTLAGLRHIVAQHRNRLENIALISDLFVGAVLTVYLVWTLARV
jgi:hypothetical protein